MSAFHKYYLLCRATDIAAVWTIFNVLSYDALSGRNSNLAPSQQRVDALRIEPWSRDYWNWFLLSLYISENPIWPDQVGSLQRGLEGGRLWWRWLGLERRVQVRDHFTNVFYSAAIWEFTVSMDVNIRGYYDKGEIFVILGCHFPCLIVVWPFIQ